MQLIRRRKALTQITVITGSVWIGFNCLEEQRFRFLNNLEEQVNRTVYSCSI